MFAIIMAGGEGERLRPLTCTLPKPMALILDKPIMHYTLMLLKKHGVTDAAVTLGYLPEKIIDEFSDGASYGMKLKYYTENHPLGTAGGVKQASDFLTDTFCVLSGDGLTDMDLTNALAFHKSKNALATICLTTVKDPTAYGLVNTDDSGRVVSFLEKPSWKNVNTDRANTGVYILEKEVLDYIPDNAAFDFGKQLFPLLLEKGLPVYGYTCECYWCDIGDISAYMKANQDALSGKFSLITPPSGGIFRMPGAIVDERATIEAPAMIGAYARIDKGAFIGSGSILSSHAHVGENASVKRSILYPGAIMKSGAQARGAILSGGSILSENAGAFEECVIGEKTLIEKSAVIRPGVKIWPGKRIFESMKISTNIVWGQSPAHPFSGNSLVTKTPEEAVSAARVLAWKTGVKQVLVGRDPSTVSQSQERAFIAGLASQGVQVYLLSECTLPLIRHALSITGLDAAYYVRAETVTPVTNALLPFSRDEKRMIEAALARQDVPPPYTGLTRRTEALGRFDLTYLTFLESAAVGAVRRLKTAVFAQTEPLMYLAVRILMKTGFPVRVEWEEDMMELDETEIGAYFSENGSKVIFADDEGILNAAENELLFTYALLKNGERIICAPPGATRALTVFSKDTGAEIRYFEDDYEWAKAMKNLSPHQFHMRFDALYACVNILTRLSEEGVTLKEFRKHIPHIVRLEREIPLPDAMRASALRKFRESTPDDFSREEWFFRSKHGCAWVSPNETRPCVTLTAEAQSTEFAAEIIDTLADILEKAKINRKTDDR